MLEPWRVFESRITYEDRWLKVRSDGCVDRSGRVIEPYHVLEFPTWVNVVALTTGGQIVLAREYRHGVGAILTGLPCGTMEPADPDLERTARRELLEETGYAGGRFASLMTHHANPANQDNAASNVLLLGVEPTGSRDLDPNEEIEVIVEDYVGFMARFWRGDVAIQVSHAAALHQAALTLMKGSGEADGQRNALRELFHRVISGA